MITQILWRFWARPERFREGFPYRRADRVRTWAHALKVRLWLQTAVRAMPEIRPLILQQPTFEHRSPLSP